MNELIKKIEACGETISVEEGDPIDITGSDEELRKVEQEVLSDFICDNGVVGGKPEVYGRILVCYEGEGKENGYMVFPGEEAAQLEQADKCAAAAVSILFKGAA